MTRNELNSSEKAFIKTLIFSMESLLSDTTRNEIQINATRYGRLMSGLKNGSRDTLSIGEIRAFTEQLLLVHRHWPMDSDWMCSEIVGGRLLTLEFKRKKRLS
jgi:hypothetical protein